MPHKELSVSVIIPTYNRAHLIRRALNSVLQQLLPQDEVVVIDDGSSDDTQKILSEFNDPRLWVVHQPNSGAGAARNHGARLATKTLLAFLDSDDEWLHGKLLAQRRFMNANPEVLFSFTDFVRQLGDHTEQKSLQYWHTDSRTWSEILQCQPKTFASGTSEFTYYTGNLYYGEMYTNYVLTSSVLIRRVEAGNAVHFNPDTKTFEDWECWGHLARRGPAAYLDFESAIQHAHPGARLTDAGLLTSSEARLAVLEAVWGSDPSFLESYEEEYKSLYRNVQLDKIRGHLILGQTKQARDLARKLDQHVPTSYQTLCLMPGPMVSSLLALRRTIFGLRPQHEFQSRKQKVY